ncbi:hypothetical protein SAMN02745218_02633 [Desulfofundulus australicus DSM 11792]|jgi:hypothetical protein|uniref:Uncharacterized protein n=1 Tax=Desulfofundulus australicus DSM 11792 TaxID=1121425 RepID=A0A1M5CV45_9FIRM|nr:MULTISPECIES: hypothetical protein [Desulfofundulus]MDK2887564.1 hypothetical protein [Thermoanaerobacter sp.]SHF58292.1 hypothetical protein SAMN02745218_02633 [Desulfofundulus australicus DSM 11792]
MLKAKDMTMEQITHTFCSWCKYRRVSLGQTYWECGLQEKDLQERCPYRKAVRKEEEGAN